MSDKTETPRPSLAGRHQHDRPIDPVTGYDTTGHDWNGITELNTGMPKLVIWALVLTFIYSVIAWILLPAWPLGRDYTRGVLGLDQGDMAVEGFRDLESVRLAWLTRFEEGDFAALAADEALMAQARPAAARLFEDNCAACHGSVGQGGPGFPVLADDYWLWSGEPEEIAVTLRYGINSEHPDTRFAEMPAFDWMSLDERTQLAEFVASMPSGRANFDSPAGALFSENCSSCHGDAGEGGLGIGAPSLTDASVIYGESVRSVMTTLRNGRHGVMPAWTGRLPEADINLLALYVTELSESGGEVTQ